VLAFLGADQNIIFSAALLLMLLIGAIEAIGLGGSALHFDPGDLHLGDIGDTILGWLGVGRLPLLMWLVAFLAVFGIVGLAAQQIMLGMAGTLLPVAVAGPGAALIALPVTGLVARGLTQILPHDESSAVPLDTLIGQHATIVIGRARQGSPARARVHDQFGQSHYVMAEPENDGQSFAEGEEIVLVRRHGTIFRAIGTGHALLPELDIP